MLHPADQVMRRWNWLSVVCEILEGRIEELGRQIDSGIGTDRQRATMSVSQQEAMDLREELEILRNIRLVNLGHD